MNTKQSSVIMLIILLLSLYRLVVCLKTGVCTPQWLNNWTESIDQLGTLRIYPHPRCQCLEALIRSVCR